MFGKRFLHHTSRTLAKKAVAKPKGGKSKVKQGFKTKKDGDSKVKKSGMTHLRFKDAVRNLGFEKTAKPLPADIQDLTEETLASDAILKYNTAIQDKFTQLGLFKRYQHHELFTSPILIVSENLRQLNDGFIKNLDKQYQRLILLGDYRVGKSTILAQIHSLALSKYRPIVLHFDYPNKIIDGSSNYIFNKKLGLYQQPMLTKRWIIKMREANKEVFSQLKLTKDVSFITKKTQYDYKAGENNLYEFLTNCHDFGKNESTVAFEYFVNELKTHSKEVPVLLSVDNFNALTSSPLSKYRHPDFTPIYVLEFELGKFIWDFVAGKQTFEKGGVLLAESKDHGKDDNLAIGLGLKEHQAYTAADEQLVPLLEGVKTFHLENLSKDQVATLCEFYHQQEVLYIRDYNYKESERENIAGLQELINVNYMRSAGNPGLLLKSVVLTY